MLLRNSGCFVISLDENSKEQEVDHLLSESPSVERMKKATLYVFLRGFIFIVPCFIILPRLLGNMGIWLAMPVSELITFMFIALSVIPSRLKSIRK